MRTLSNLYKCNKRWNEILEPVAPSAAMYRYTEPCWPLWEEWKHVASSVRQKYCTHSCTPVIMLHHSTVYSPVVQYYHMTIV